MARNGVGVWTVATGCREVVVAAPSAREAMDAACEWPHDEFGLIVSAAPFGEPEDETVVCRTARLLTDWGDPETALRYVETAIAMGLGDTSEDLKPRKDSL